MKLVEFVEAVESYGVTCPLTNTSSLRTFYRNLLGVRPVGSGHRHRYNARQIRHLVSWLVISQTAGDQVGDGSGTRPSTQAVQRRQAMHLMAAAPCGYVVMSQGRAWWSYAPPVTALKSDSMAVAIPVPAWRH